MDEKHFFIQIMDNLSQGDLKQAHTLATEAIEQYPSSGKLHFIHAAIDAQSEQYESAIERYLKALQYDPELHIARFQLGLLLATLGQGESSIDFLRPLSEDTNHYLGCFSRGLILILTADDESETNLEKLQEAANLLQKGIQLNQENLHLNDDMRAMLQRINGELDEKQSAQNVPESDLQEEVDQSHLLDVYNRPQ